MRLLADENIPGEAVAALRVAGHDVAWIRVDQPGSADHDVLARAHEESRVLLTFDKDFGELAWRERLPAACGVMLFRLPMPVSTDIGRVIVEIVNVQLAVPRPPLRRDLERSAARPFFRLVFLGLCPHALVVVNQFRRTLGDRQALNHRQERRRDTFTRQKEIDQ